MTNFAPPEIFKAYDIRGIVATALTSEAVENIGLAIGSRRFLIDFYRDRFGGHGRSPSITSTIAVDRWFV